MATLPRSSRFPPGTQSSSLKRPVSEFDSGINTSTAWTEHLGTEESISRVRSKQYLSELDGPFALSDEDKGEEEPEVMTRPARALYPFEGKAEFRELCVEAGDELDIIKEDVGHGWSLVRDVTGEIGLLPQTYYTLTVEFSLAPDLQLDVTRKREASSSSLTPRPSPRSSQSQSSLAALLPQNTGEWIPTFPSFRQSLLGGKSLNRFSSFVTSGAESFLLNGSTIPAPPPPTSKTEVSHAREDTSASMLDALEEERAKDTILGLGEADRHIIDAGPAGPRWHAKTPSFNIIVHSPSKRMSGLSGAYTMYNVTSLFPAPPIPAVSADWIEVADPDDHHPSSPTSNETATRITVQRRFSHFVMLHTALSRRLPGIVLPPLPEKQYAGRFSEDFVEARRGDLERYLNKIVRHPIIRYAEVVTFFLGCNNDSEWIRLLPQYTSAPAAGPSFYARVYHPAFNVDFEDAEETVKLFKRHTSAVGKGVQSLRNVFGRVREARIEMSKAERLLSYTLLSLITSTPIASDPAPGLTNEEESEATSHSPDKFEDKRKGLVNNEGAWCWRDGCAECLKLTKAAQKTCETLQTVANLYDGHARRTQLATHESLKLMAHPSSLYESTITTHKSTLSRYREAIGVGNRSGPTYADENMVARCETVLNTTIAEMDVYHKQKSEDLKAVTVDHLDGEIAFYEQILTRLKGARALYNDSQYNELASSPRLPSIYEKDLVYDPSNPHNGANPHLVPRPLPQPCPHVFDSTPMRPVSVAIQEGVGMFLGDSAGRGSVFSRFW